MKDNTIRKNVRISHTLAEWYEKKSKETGVSQSSLMAIACNEWMKDQESEKNVISIDEFMGRMEEIKNTMPEK